MTNKIVLRSTEEFMSGYTPVYQPIFPLFLGKSQSYSEEVGQIDFKRVSTVGDIRAKHITPKDTEIKQISVNAATKSFKKYFLANQYVQSTLQDTQGIEDVTAQVLDEHNKQADDLLLTGDSGINNGLFTSSDSNYLLQSSAVVSKGAAEDHLLDMHGKIVSAATMANNLPGQKVLIVYGATALAKYNALHAANVTPFKTVLADVLGDNYSQIEMPSDVTPSGNGFIIANIDMVKLHYTTLPKLAAQGVNEEKMYTWHNFLLGSMMLELLAKNAVIRQPVTFEA